MVIPLKLMIICKMDVKNNIKEFELKLEGTGCKLVAVSKTKPNDLIMEAYQAGFKDFGENKIQDLVEKYETLPKDIRWHMIGHLQRNKVKYIAHFIHLIHAVDSLKLLKEIDKQGKKHNKVINCLLQIHIAQETSKFGLDTAELKALLHSEDFASMENVKIVGLMGMATNTVDNSLIRKEFQSLKELFESIKSNYNLPNLLMQEISMGMSGDFTIAIEEGSTMVRVGSAIFGKRNY